MFDGFFFDLDGTLVDTAPDLGGALNRVLIDEGLPERSANELRPVISHGALGLLKRGFGIDPSHAAYDRLRDRLLWHYERNLCEESSLFPGMAELLEALDQRGIPWGIITNKPEYLAKPLCDDLGLTANAACVIGGSDQTQAKPNPERLLLALEQTALDAQRCCYIGDDLRDIQAANSSGMTSIAAHYGYIMEDDEPQRWPADIHIQHPRELLGLLSQ